MNAKLTGRSDEFVGATLQRFSMSVFAAPGLFCSAMAAEAYLSRGGMEIGIYLALYLWTVVVLVIPAVLTAIGLVLVRPGRVQTVAAVVAFVVYYPSAQMIAFVGAADALSSPLPDDPPFAERVIDTALHLEPPFLRAAAVAVLFAIWIGAGCKQKAGSDASGF